MSGRTSFSYRVDEDNGYHVWVTVFAGPDEQHRAHCGQLTFRAAEWADFQDRLIGPGHIVVVSEPA